MSKADTTSHRTKRQTKKRTCPKRQYVRFAEAIETMIRRLDFSDRRRDCLDAGGKARAELIQHILWDSQNDTHIFCDDPRIVRAYVLAAWEDHFHLDDSRDYEEMTQKFAEIQDLLAGYATDPNVSVKNTPCSEARIAELDAKYNYNVPDRSERDTQAAPELEGLRQQFAQLERVPENEAIALQLESEIYRLENQSDLNEWPDVIGGDNA